MKIVVKTRRSWFDRRKNDRTISENEKKFWKTIEREATAAAEMGSAQRRIRRSQSREGNHGVGGSGKEEKEIACEGG